MSTRTTNYNLVKPSLTDAPPDITVMNSNWDTVDSKMKEFADGLANLLGKFTSDEIMELLATVPITKGGTGGTTQAEAKANLGFVEATDTVANATNASEAAQAVKLKTSRNLQVDLTKTTAVSFNGTAAVNLGVSGTLAMANGGTGSDTRTGAWHNLTYSTRATVNVDELEDGVYSINLTSAYTSNNELRLLLGTTSSVYAIVTQVSDGSGGKVQTAYRYGSSTASAYRCYYNNAWGAWSRAIYADTLASDVQALFTGGELSVVKSVQHINYTTKISSTTYKSISTVNTAKSTIIVRAIDGSGSYTGSALVYFSNSSGSAITTGNASYITIIPGGAYDSSATIRVSIDIIEYA